MNLKLNTMQFFRPIAPITKPLIQMLMLLLASSSLIFADCVSNVGASCSNTTLAIEIDDLNCVPQTIDEYAYGQTFFSLRPAHSDMARDLMGTDSRIHNFIHPDFNGDASLAIQWQQSTSSKGLADWFFFNGSNTMSYGPNWTEGNYGVVDVNSLNFGVTASGNITASPQVQELIADFQFFLGWDEFIPGLWTRIGVPINFVRTDMRLLDIVSTADANQANPGYFNQGDFSNGINTDTLSYTNLAAAWVGDKSIGDWAGRKNGNINGRQDRTSVSGLVLEAGYDFFRYEHGHFGLSLRLVAPTGNEPTCNYLFDPVVGANGCFELGGGFNSAYQLYSTSNDSSLGFYLNANVTHLFSRNQKRLMGLTSLRDGGKSSTITTGTGSNLPSAGAQWLLLAEYTSAGQYNNTLISAADQLALVIKVHNTIMADLGASLRFDCASYGFELGYNFWARTKDIATAREASVYDTNNYGIKPASGNHGSTILNGATPSYIAIKNQSDISTTGVNQLTTDTPSQYLTDSDISVCPALQPTCISNKLFANISYTWSDNEWNPYLLIGGTYEVGATFNNIKNSALNQWSVIAKGGIAF